MKQCVEHAFQNNLSLKIEETNLNVSEIDYKQARNDLYPDLNAGVNSGLSFNKSPGSNNSFVDKNSFSTDFNVNSSITLFNGMQNVNNMKLKSAQLNASRQMYKYNQEMLALDIASAYLNILLDEELIKAQKVQLSISEETQRKLDIKFQSGAVSKSVLIENKAQLAQEQARMVELENNRNYDLLVLAQKLEISNPDSFQIVTPETPFLKAELSIMTANELFTGVVEKRPEIEAARLNVEAKQYNLKIAKSYYYPNLSFQASYSNGYYDYDPSGFSKQIAENDRKYLGVSMQIPIFNKFQVQNRVKISRLNIQKSEFEYENQKKQFRETIQKAFFKAKADYASLNAYQLSLEAATEAYDFAQEKFESGAISVFDYNELKNKVTLAQSNYLNSLYRFIFSAKILDFYAGKPIEL